MLQCHRYTWVYYSMYILSFYILNHAFYHFLSFFSLCHTVTEPNMAQSAVHTSLLFTINLLPLTSAPIPHQNIESCCSKYQKLINCSYSGDNLYYKGEFPNVY